MITHNELLQDALYEITISAMEYDGVKELPAEVDAILLGQLKKLANDYNSEYIGDYVKKYIALMDVTLESYSRYGVPYKTE